MIGIALPLYLIIGTLIMFAPKLVKKPSLELSTKIVTLHGLSYNDIILSERTFVLPE